MISALDALVALIKTGSAKGWWLWRFSPSAGAAAILGAGLSLCCALLPVVAPGRPRSRRGGWQESSRPPGTSPRRELAAERPSCASPSAAGWLFCPLVTGGAFARGFGRLKSVELVSRSRAFTLPCLPSPP